MELRSRDTMVVVILLSLLSIFALVESITQGDRSSDVKSPSRVQTMPHNHIQVGERRSLIGLGSYPPRCSAKCGGCAPCLAVHVPLPPTHVTTENYYYPEAWRCKCGNRLYMP